MHHPPGRKVYQRGAHTIWEVDGAAQKVSFSADRCAYLQVAHGLISALLPKFIPFRKIFY